MALSQVVPAESEGQEDNTESIDLFEVLEDRYAYEGFNKFAFLLLSCFLLCINACCRHMVLMMSYGNKY